MKLKIKLCDFISASGKISDAGVVVVAKTEGRRSQSPVEIKKRCRHSGLATHGRYPSQ